MFVNTQGAGLQVRSGPEVDCAEEKTVKVIRSNATAGVGTKTKLVKQDQTLFTRAPFTSATTRTNARLAPNNIMTKSAYLLQEECQAGRGTEQGSLNRTGWNVKDGSLEFTVHLQCNLRTEK